MDGNSHSHRPSVVKLSQARVSVKFCASASQPKA
jgi:hypothetical protein